MFQAVHLEPNMVPTTLRQGYTGKMFKAIVCETMTIPPCAGLWSGGSRDKYTVIQLETGRTISPVNHNAAPWDDGRHEMTVKLEPGIAVVEHSIFAGKDMGLTFYLHPDNARKLLPAPVELNELEKTVLETTAAYKASYMGRDRYQMAREDARYGDKPFATRPQWEAAKAALIARGLLNKAGAITVAGRNARGVR